MIVSLRLKSDDAKPKLLNARRSLLADRNGAAARIRAGVPAVPGRCSDWLSYSDTLIVDCILQNWVISIYNLKSGTHTQRVPGESAIGMVPPARLERATSAL
jgi:hypothetical protein